MDHSFPQFPDTLPQDEAEFSRLSLDIGAARRRWMQQDWVERLEQLEKAGAKTAEWVCGEESCGKPCNNFEGKALSLQQLATQLRLPMESWCGLVRDEIAGEDPADAYCRGTVCLSDQELLPEAEQPALSAAKKPLWRRLLGL